MCVEQRVSSFYTLMKFASLCANSVLQCTIHFECREKSLFFVAFFFFVIFSAVFLILVEVPCSQSDRSIASLVFKKK